MVMESVRILRYPEALALHSFKFKVRKSHVASRKSHVAWIPQPKIRTPPPHANPCMRDLDMFPDRSFGSDRSNAKTPRCGLNRPVCGDSNGALATWA